MRNHIDVPIVWYKFLASSISFLPYIVCTGTYKKKNIVCTGIDDLVNWRICNLAALFFLFHAWIDFNFPPLLFTPWEPLNSMKRRILFFFYWYMKRRILSQCGAIFVCFGPFFIFFLFSFLVCIFYALHSKLQLICVYLRRSSVLVYFIVFGKMNIPLLIECSQRGKV